MTVTPTTSTPTTPVTASSAASSQAQLSSNFNTFLTLLTTQLQNQDPLSPMDSNQFTQQLVQFSQVEQQIDSNKNLESLISLTKTQSATNAVSYLGKTLTVTDGTAALQTGSDTTWAYSLPGDASSTKLMVTDSKGHAVYTATGETASGLHAFTWDGTTSAGNMAPAGTYKLTVAATASDGTALTSSIASQGTVTEVDLTGNEPTLMIGPLGIPLSKATLISGQ
ncbi:MAG TPA: flagellar hook capping FlgD N-terminal domain-containing protein [Micropepsaceae bacterium]|nr:flagellar hook capping FlgD N-terminal domain-containing protein [Micropepsaceae bacterium]